MSTFFQKHGLRILAHIGALVPLALLVWDGVQGQLSVNPIQDIILRTGEAALIVLVLSLACTPLNLVARWRQVLPLRRTLGLYAFAYASLHVLAFVGLDYGFQFDLLVQALAEKRYIIAGFFSFLILLALAITSTRGWMRRLGKKWKPLHRMVYVAAPLAVLHFLWLVKGDKTEPLLYGIVVGILLVARLPVVKRRVSRKG